MNKRGRFWGLGVVGTLALLASLIVASASAVAQSGDLPDFDDLNNVMPPPQMEATPEAAGPADGPSGQDDGSEGNQDADPTPTAQATPTPARTAASNARSTNASPPPGCSNHRLAAANPGDTAYSSARLATGPFFDYIEGIEWADDAPLVAVNNGNTVIDPPYVKFRRESFTQTVSWDSQRHNKVRFGDEVIRYSVYVGPNDNYDTVVACNVAEMKRRVWLNARDAFNGLTNAAGMRIVVAPVVVTEVGRDYADGPLLTFSTTATVSGTHSVFIGYNKNHLAYSTWDQLTRNWMNAGILQSATPPSSSVYADRYAVHKFRIPGVGDRELYEMNYDVCRGLSAGYYRLLNKDLNDLNPDDNRPYSRCRDLGGSFPGSWNGIDFYYGGRTYRVTGKLHQINQNGTVVLEVRCTDCPPEDE